MIDDFIPDHKFILDEHGIPRKEKSVMKWVTWYERSCETGERSVALTKLEGCDVSTVFLGLDHGFGSEIPIVWETMVFGGPLDREMWRCGGTREQAEAQHESVVALVEKEMLFEQRNQGKDDEQSS